MSRRPPAPSSSCASDGEWLRDGKKIPFTAASDLLEALTAAKAERLVERRRRSAPPAPAPPRLTVTLSDADGNEEVLTLLAAATRRGGGSGANPRPRGDALLPRAWWTSSKRRSPPCAPPSRSRARRPTAPEA